MGYRLSDYLGASDPLTGVYQPDVRPTARRAYMLIAAFSVWVKVPGTDTDLVIAVPAGFKLDGASVPRLVWTVSGLTPDGLIRAAALVHDYLYRCRGRVKEGSVLLRAEADQIFLDMMLAAGISRARARMAYRAVRMFARRW